MFFDHCPDREFVRNNEYCPINLACPGCKCAGRVGDLIPNRVVSSRGRYHFERQSNAK